MKKTFLAIASLAAAACGGNEHKTEAATAAPVAVQTVEARQVEWPAQYEAVGTVRARTSATLSARVMGYIRELRVRPGDRVAAGQLIAVLDARELEAGRRTAEAARQEARSGIPEADNAMAAAQAQLRLAETTHTRMHDLFEKKSISNQEFDEATARFRVAQANFAMARARREQLDSKIRQAEEGVRSAEIMHGYSEVRSPFAGVVTEKHADQGALASPGMPLVTVEQAGVYRVEAQVDESMMGRLRVGQAVSVRFDAAGETVAAKIDEIVPAVDPGSRAFLVKAALPGSPGIRSGMFARLLVPGETRQVVVVPRDAVSTRGDLASVLVNDNGVARMRVVSTGRAQGSDIEILSGLRGGDQIVYPRPASVTDGARLEARR